MSALGVIGTMVWDTIQRDSAPGISVQEWGGISYALAAGDAVAPAGLELRPILKVGRDLAERAYWFIRGLDAIESDESIVVVDDPNPRVELHYAGDVRRCERIRGGVPRWSWPELRDRIPGCDALYVNFITGDEMDLATAKSLRRSFEGPIYVDLHSLLLARVAGGERSPRPLSEGLEWLSCFDAVQVNEDELSTLAAPWGDPWAFAAHVVGEDTRALFVTLGSRGAAYVVAPGGHPLQRGTRSAVQPPHPVRTGKVATEPVSGGDATGCGDVWGITCCCALLEAADVEAAVRRANAMASRNVSHRGATGLNRFLRGELEL